MRASSIGCFDKMFRALEQLENLCREMFYWFLSLFIVGIGLKEIGRRRRRRRRRRRHHPTETEEMIGCSEDDPYDPIPKRSVTRGSRFNDYWYMIR